MHIHRRGGRDARATGLLATVWLSGLCGCGYHHVFDNCTTSGPPTKLCCGDDWFEVECVGLTYDAAGWNPITCCR